MPTRPEDVRPDVAIDVDHHSVEFNLDEVAATAAVRQRCPVAYDTRYGGFWFVTGYDEVATVAREVATFAHKYEPEADDGVCYIGDIGIPRPPELPALGVSEVDGPYHLELRRALNPLFSPPAVERQREFMERAADWFVDQHIERGAMDLVLDFTSTVPAVLTLRMLGLPCEDWRYYTDFFHSTKVHPTASEEHDRAASLIPVILDGFAELAARRRAAPTDDLCSFLVRLEVDGSPLGDEQVLAILWNLVSGGLDTTTALTSWTLHHLAGHPEVRQLLIDRPDLHAPATEEYLRYYSINQTLARTVARDVELGGQQLRRGDPLLVSWLGANHDPAQFDRPDEVVVDRADNRHLAFGLGPHRCIGSHLARTMFRVMLGTVLRRIPDYAVDPDGVGEYLGNPAMTGLLTMPATFTPGPVVGVERPF